MLVGSCITAVVGAFVVAWITSAGASKASAEEAAIGAEADAAKAREKLALVHKLDATAKASAQQLKEQLNAMDSPLPPPDDDSVR
jgi:hypothetical protein